MSYQLRHHESPGEGLRRICRQQIERALAIAHGREPKDDTPVHCTRKHLKKARAVLRIVGKEIGHGLFRQQDRWLRDVGRLISEIRDAEVRLQTVRDIQGLKHRRNQPAFAGLERMLVLELENFMAAFAGWQTQAVPLLEQACSAVDRWPVDQFTAKQLRRAVQKTYKCGRHALADAGKNPSTKNFHELRTSAKLLGYQLRILRPANPVVLKGLTDELSALGSLLGRAHDLSFLGERLRLDQDGGSQRPESRKLLALIGTSQRDLQRGAAELADRFYAERPRDFGHRLTGWLDGWHKSAPASVAGALAGK